MSSCVSPMMIFETNTRLFYEQNKRNYNGKCLNVCSSFIIIINTNKEGVNQRCVTT